MTSFVYEVFPVQEVNGLVCGNAFGKNHLNVLSSNQNIMYLLTEWEGRMGKYWPEVMVYRPSAKYVPLHDSFWPKSWDLYSNKVVSVRILQRAIRNSSRARQLFPALLAPSWLAFLNSFAIKGGTGHTGHIIKACNWFHVIQPFIDDIVMPSITASQTIFS